MSVNERDVKFVVCNIEKAEKVNCVKVDLKFDDDNEVREFTRRAYNNTVVIDGCRIYFTDNYKYLKSVREYNTAGIKKLSTAKQVITGKQLVEKTIEKQKIQEPIQNPIDYSGEIHHDKYEEIKCCLECNIPVYLAGPAGSGKNYTVEQIAKDLGWEFYFSNSVQQEYKLTGFIDAGGKFHETEFYKACHSDKECVFFLDEMDASIPEVLVLLNAAIANGYFEFPTGRIDFDNVHFVSAGNTVGSGADDMYTGRMVLDQATLDRFAIIEFDYCRNIEMSISKGNESLVNFVHELRKETESKGIRATFSYRCITMVTKLESKNLELTTILKLAVLKGLDKDTINTLYVQNNSKYGKALREVQKVA